MPIYIPSLATKKRKERTVVQQTDTWTVSETVSPISLHQGGSEQITEHLSKSHTLSAFSIIKQTF